MKKIPENVSAVIKAILPLVVILTLFVILGQIGFAKISDIREKISAADHDQLILTQKLDMLKTVSQTGVHDANVVTNTLPDNNPSLVVVSQLKNIGGNLQIDSIKSAAGPSEANDLNTVQISFTVRGDRDGIESFLNSINTFAPLSILNKVKLAQSGGNFSADVTVISYWSPLPTKLPDTIEDFGDITAEDKQTLANISALAQPQFVSLPPADSNGKTDPFSQ